jgi:hypothetical protein
VGEAFIYTIYTLKDYKKIAFLTLLLYIIVLTWFIPNLGITTLPLGLIVLFSATSFFVTLAQKTRTLQSYIYNLKQQNMWATMLDCIPTSVSLTGGLLIVGGIVLVAFLYLFHNNNFYQELIFWVTQRSEIFVTSVILGFIYIFMVTYNFPGKLGKIIFSDTFGQKLFLFFSIFFDIRFPFKAFHLDYLLIYFRWITISSILLYFLWELVSKILFRQYSALLSFLFLLMVVFIFIFVVIFTFFSGWKSWELIERIEEEEEMRR